MKTVIETRNDRVNRMSRAYDELREASERLKRATEQLEALAPQAALLKDYLVSGRWMEDFEADERGEFGPEVNRSVLSEDGLYNLLEDLDDIKDCWEEGADDPLAPLGR